MKKILFLLLVTISSYAQTYQNPTFGTVKSMTAPTVSTTPTLGTIEANGTISKIVPNNVPITYTPINYAPSSTSIADQLAGIDTRLGQIGNVTAGVTTRVHLTGDNITVTAGTFFASNTTGKGATAAGTPQQTLSNNDDQKQYFTKDVMSVAVASLTTAPPGVYSGQLTVTSDPTPGTSKQRFTIEIYKCNNGGTPIASGITGAPVGDLGVTVVAILDSGLINVVASALTNIGLQGNLASTLTLNTGERLRYHVSAEKVGVDGGAVTMNVYYGTNYNSYYDIPVTFRASTVLNDSGVVGQTVADALNTLDTGKANNSDVIHTTGNLSETANGLKTFSDQLTFGETSGSPQELWKMPANSLLKYNNLQTNQYDFNITTLGADSFFWLNDEGNSRQCLLYADGDSTIDSDVFGISGSQDSGGSWNKNFSVTQGGNVYVRSLLTLNAETASTIAGFDASKNVKSLSTATYPNLTELSYVKGATSSIQTQLNGKQATLTNPVTGVGVSGQVSFWNSTSNQIGDTAFLWDNTNKRLGIGTPPPDWSLTINRPFATSLKAVNSASSGASAGATLSLQSDDASAIADGDRLGAYAFGGRYDVSNVANSVGGIYAFAKGNWTSINNAPADIHVQTRQLGTNNTMAIFGADGVFYLGTTSGNISNDPAMLIKRNITGSSGLNAHAYVDESIINRDGTIGYNSYDCKTEIQGTFAYDHFAGFQSRPRFASSGNIDRLVGYQSLPYTSTTGTVNNIFGYDVYDPTGTGTVTNNYGLHVRTLTRGANNWGVYVQTNNSYFGGKIISNNTVRLKNYTVATLPAGTQGDTAYVTDATAPTYLGTLTGGGSVVCPVFYNGSAWVSH